VASFTQGQGVSAALAIAGKASAYQAALHSIAPFGTLVCVGIPPLCEEVSFHPLLLIDKGIRIIGSAVGTREDIGETVEFLVSGKVVPDVQVVEFDQLISILDPKHANEVSTSAFTEWNILLIVPLQGSKYVVRIP
jgi:propanol-preferring alcohol dehydrogenase